MNDPLSELATVDLTEVKRAVGDRTFGRGRSYARGGRVLAMEWDPEDLVLVGAVSGTSVYATQAFFDEVDGRLVFDDGECACPVGYNCKHVAAIVIAAVDEGAGTAAARRGPRAPRAEADNSSWERSLRDLVGAPATPAAGRPLAIELSLRPNPTPHRDRPKLMARLMRPGARGGWVNGSLSWNALDSWQVRDGGFRADHLALAHELQAVHAVQQREASYGYYGYSRGDGRTLDLSECDSPRLWSLLEEASRLGMRLIHAAPGLGELPPHEAGEVLLDVRRDGDSSSLVTAALRLEDGDPEGLEPQLFLGASGHGIVCAEREQGAGEHDAAEGSVAEPDPARSRLRLVRLGKPVPAQLQRMLLEGERLAIPEEELERFAVEFCPALRRLAPLVSSDGSFEPPQIGEPELVLRASYGAGHSVDLGWEWSYPLGSRTLRVPLGDGAAPGFRDRRAERAALTATSLEEGGLEHFGLLDEAGQPVESPAVSLTGLETMRLTTEVLPLLRERGVTVEVEGEPADYRDVGESLEIGVSTAEIAGESDWFDLGVTVSVEGRELPLADVFVAVAPGQSHLLLDDGAHLSLADPRLETLRQLIVEAQSLVDGPAGSLRISRYQAGLWAELAALGVVAEQAEAWRRQVGALLELEQVGGHDPPAAFAAELRPYQREGFGWLATLRELGLGGILADDMGLGKTLQALALFCHTRERDPDAGPFLVVAPASVVSNWASEAARFAPGLTVSAVTDTLRKSGRSIGEVASADLVVTTYTLFRLTPRPTARCAGRAWCSTRHRWSRTTSRRPTAACASWRRRSSWRSAGPRWRTT